MVISKLFNFIKRVITSSIVIYTYDSFNLPLNTFIPINFVTVLIVTIFGIYGIIGMVVLAFFL